MTNDQVRIIVVISLLFVLMPGMYSYVHEKIIKNNVISKYNDHVF